MKNNRDTCILAAIALVKELMKSNDPSHDWYHVERVWKMAIHLAEKESEYNSDLDLLVIELGALFHDIVDFKYDKCEAKDLKGKVDERLSEFFKAQSNECSPEQREKIVDIILNISWRKELELKHFGQNPEVSGELKIVRDADRLDAIGAVGIARVFAFSGDKHRPFYMDDLPPIQNMTAEEYNEQSRLNKSTAINHFHEKLLLVRDKIHTTAGKELAEKRHQYMVEYLKQFDLEITCDS